VRACSKFRRRRPPPATATPLKCRPLRPKCRHRHRFQLPNPLILTSFRSAPRQRYTQCRSLPLMVTSIRTAPWRGRTQHRSLPLMATSFKSAPWRGCTERCTVPLIATSFTSTPWRRCTQCRTSLLLEFTQTLRCLKPMQRSAAHRSLEVAGAPTMARMMVIVQTRMMMRPWRQGGWVAYSIGPLNYCTDLRNAVTKRGREVVRVGEVAAALRRGKPQG
jgi:hypothetical protein